MVATISTIKIKSSSVAAQKPPTLELGELAINTQDGALYYSDGASIKNIIDNSRFTYLTGLNISDGSDVTDVDNILSALGKFQNRTASALSAINTINTVTVPSLVSQDMIGSEPNQVPANQFLGRLAFQDNTGIQVVYRHVPSSKIGDVWREWVSNTETVLKRHCEDGVIRSLSTETWT